MTDAATDPKGAKTSTEIAGQWGRLGPGCDEHQYSHRTHLCLASIQRLTPQPCRTLKTGQRQNPQLPKDYAEQANRMRSGRVA